MSKIDKVPALPEEGEKQMSPKEYVTTVRSAVKDKREKGSEVRGQSCFLKREQQGGSDPERQSSLPAGSGRVPRL